MESGIGKLAVTWQDDVDGIRNREEKFSEAFSGLGATGQENVERTRKARSVLGTGVTVVERLDSKR